MTHILSNATMMTSRELMRKTIHETIVTGRRLNNNICVADAKEDDLPLRAIRMDLWCGSAVLVESRAVGVGVDFLCRIMMP